MILKQVCCIVAAYLFFV